MLLQSFFTKMFLFYVLLYPQFIPKWNLIIGILLLSNRILSLRSTTLHLPSLSDKYVMTQTVLLTSNSLLFSSTPAGGAMRCLQLVSIIAGRDNLCLL